MTIAGALVQQNAEALCGIAFTQMVRRGAPVMYGGFTSNVDMKTGAPAFGTPEYMKAVVAGGQLARKYNIPYRTSNTNAANTLDAQAAYESAMSLWALTQGGGNFVMHAAGWTEGGLTASFEKFILDVDMLQMVAEYLAPLDVSEDALGLDAVRDVGPVATTSVRYTRCSATKRPSIRPSFPTGAISRPGPKPDGRQPTTTPTGSSSRSSTNTSGRPSTLRSRRSSMPSSPSARRKAASRRTSDGTPQEMQ